jgi:hypothetical protein
VGRPVPTIQKKLASKPVKSAGSLRVKNYRHGLGVKTGPVHVPGWTGSTGNRPNRIGSHRFCEPCQILPVVSKHLILQKNNFYPHFFHSRAGLNNTVVIYVFMAGLENGWT